MLGCSSATCLCFELTSPRIKSSGSTAADTPIKMDVPKAKSSSAMAWISSRFNSATTQIVFLSMVCFCCPGIFNSLNALGGAGQSDPTVANNTNAALYACFAVFGFAGGLFFNIFGNRVLLGCGGLTYVFYVVCQYVAARMPQYEWLAITSGAVLGIGAGLFWTAQGAMMMAYPTENLKGTFVAIVWVIFNLGGVIGGFAAMVCFLLTSASRGINFNNEAGAVSPATYFTFAAIMMLGSLGSFVLLVPPNKVMRADGSHVEFEPATGFVSEVRGVARLTVNPIMLLLTPLFISSNFFYTYQFNCVNGALFTVRTRGLNSALYWAAQMLGAYLLGRVFLDRERLSRRRRAMWGLIIVTACFTSAWAIGLYLQVGYEGGYDRGQPLNGGLIDMTDTSRFFFPWFVFIWYGFNDALLQTFAYWLMGATTNDTAQAARYAGYYKGVQSAGAAVAWAIDNTTISYLYELLINWTLFTISVPFTAAVAYGWVTNIKQTGGSFSHRQTSLLDFHEAVQASTDNVATAEPPTALLGSASTKAYKATDADLNPAAADV